MWDRYEPPTRRPSGRWPMMSSRARWATRVAIVLSLGASISCNEGVTASRSSTILVIERIGAASGGTTDDPEP